jgi:hypothetical protein
VHRLAVALGVTAAILVLIAAIVALGVAAVLLAS